MACQNIKALKQRLKFCNTQLKGDDPMTLSVDERALATRLRVPESILALVKAKADQPLQGVVYAYEKDEERHEQMHHIPLLCVTFDKTVIEAQVLALQPQLREHGYLAFIMAYWERDLEWLLCTCASEDSLTLQGNNRGLTGIFPGQDPYELLRMQYTHLYGVGTEGLIAILQTWEQRAQFTLLGAGGRWLLLYFQTLPQDVVALAREAYELCSAFVDVYSDKLRSEGAITDETDEETEDALIAERLARDIQAKRRLLLTY
jgi:Domain of unknown function (DUF4253)